MWDKYLKLGDVFENWESGGGIIKALDAYAVPWKEAVESEILDLDYYGNYSGDKIISPIVKKLTNDDDILETANIQKLAKIIFYRFGKNWTKLWATLNFEYNPIENYSMTETEQKSGENSKTGTIKDSGTDATTDTGTTTTETERTRNEEAGGNDTTNETGTRTTENKIYGFDSETASDDNKTIETPDTETKTAYGKTNEETETQKETITRNTKSETEYGKNTATTENGTDTENRTLKRSGNIGVTTSQQMIESERELWNWDFFENVFKDIDKILTISAF